MNRRLGISLGGECYLPLPGVLIRPGVAALLGVPGSDFLGVGGGTSVNFLSTPPPVLPSTVALCTSFAARFAASPRLAGGLSASTRESARSRSCGSVVECGRGATRGRYDDREGEARDEREDEGSCERDASVRLRRAKRRLRSPSDIRVVSSAEFVTECRRSS